MENFNHAFEEQIQETLPVHKVGTFNMNREMRHRPRASVVMTVFRDFRFLDAAINSVLMQDMDDFELIVVDDGNANPDLFAGLLQRDNRIRIVTSATNVGTAAAANLGIAAANSDIIVRLDADDVCKPERLSTLLDALDRDPTLGLVGSAVLLIDEDGSPRGHVRMPESDLEIRWTILFHNPFYHSAVAFRRSLFLAAGEYRVHELVSQDHYLWFDLLPLCRMQNLPQALTLYRLNSLGLTQQNNTQPRRRTDPIREKLWSDLGLTYDLYDDTLAAAITLFIRGGMPSPSLREPAFALIERVLVAFLQRYEASQDLLVRREALRIEAELRTRMSQGFVP